MHLCSRQHVVLGGAGSMSAAGVGGRTPAGRPTTQDVNRYSRSASERHVPQHSRLRHHPQDREETIIRGYISIWSMSSRSATTSGRRSTRARETSPRPALGRRHRRQDAGRLDACRTRSTPPTVTVSASACPAPTRSAPPRSHRTGALFRLQRGSRLRDAQPGRLEDPGGHLRSNRFRPMRPTGRTPGAAPRRIHHLRPALRREGPAEDRRRGSTPLTRIDTDGVTADLHRFTTSVWGGRAAPASRSAAARGSVRIQGKGLGLFYGLQHRQPPRTRHPRAAHVHWLLRPARRGAGQAASGGRLRDEPGQPDAWRQG